MEIAPLPALNREFTTYSLDVEEAARGEAASRRVMMPARRSASGAELARIGGLVLARSCAGLGARRGRCYGTRINADIRSTDPGTNRDANTDGVVAHMVEGLVAFREDTSVGPMLADSWDISHDGRTYTFHLRQGVKFHNGAIMTSDDVVWSFKRYLDPATQWRCLSEFDGQWLCQDHRRRSAGSANRHHQARPADGAVPCRPWRGPIAARPRCFTATSLGPDGKWLRRSAPVRSSSASGSADNMSISPLRRLCLAQRAALRLYRSQEGRGRSRFASTSFPTARLRSAGSAQRRRSMSSTICRSPISTDLKDAARGEAQHRTGARPGRHSVADQGSAARRPAHPPRLALSLDTEEITDVVMQGTARANNSALPIGSPFYGRFESHGYTQDIAEAKKLLGRGRLHGQPIKLIANKRYSYVFDRAGAGAGDGAGRRHQYRDRGAGLGRSSSTATTRATTRRWPSSIRRGSIRP